VGLVQAVLAFRSTGLVADGSIAIGVTEDLRVLRTVRNAILTEARDEALRWHDLDPGVYAMKAADYGRVCRVIAVLLPDEDLQPDLHVVVPSSEGD